MAGRYNEQVAVVTGGGRGIGLAIAQRFRKEGAHVVLLDIDEKVLAEGAAACSQQAVDDGAERHVDTYALSVNDWPKVQEVFADIKEKRGRVDVLVQAAGITGTTNLKTHEVDVDNFDLVMGVNLRGIFLCCKAALPIMLERNYGRIVNIASISGKEGNPGQTAYSTSKAGVIGLTKVIGKDYAKTGITCNAIAPAVVRTPMVDAMPKEQVDYMCSKIPMGRTGELDEVAAVVAFAASPEASFTTGFVFDATGGRTVY